jgi:DNA-nicking Smr family endonuclease
LPSASPLAASSLLSRCFLRPAPPCLALPRAAPRRAARPVENNKQSPPGTIDLHGLYVKEAIERTESAIAQRQRSGQDELRVIVGKGIHSQNHQAKIKPAVEELMAK